MHHFQRQARLPGRRLAQEANIPAGSRSQHQNPRPRLAHVNAQRHPVVGQETLVVPGRNLQFQHAQALGAGQEFQGHLGGPIPQVHALLRQDRFPFQQAYLHRLIAAPGREPIHHRRFDHHPIPREGRFRVAEIGDQAIASPLGIPQSHHEERGVRTGGDLCGGQGLVAIGKKHPGADRFGGDGGLDLGDQAAQAGAVGLGFGDNGIILLEGAQGM